MMKYLRVLLWIILLMFVVGCDSNTNKEIDSKNKDNAIREYLVEYYLLVEKELYDISYTYLSPQSKTEFSLDEYKEYMKYQNKGNRLISYDISKINTNNQGNSLVDIYSKRVNPYDLEETSYPEFVNLEISENEIEMVLNDSFRLITAMGSNNTAYHNLQNKDYELAIYDSKLSLEIWPLSHISYNNLAAAYSFAGDIDNALATIDEYISIYSKIGENDYFLSSMYRLKGMNLLGKEKSKEAVMAYERALEINPADDELREWVELLKSK